MDESKVAWVTRQPAPALAPLIDGYVGYRMSGFPAGGHRGLPSRHLTLIVSIGPEIDVVSQTDAAQTPQRYRCVVGGLQASPALIGHEGAQEGVAIELTPLGSRALFGMPARALWSTSLELEDLAGTAGRELWERVQESAGWEERFAAVDDVLCRLLRDDQLEPALRRSWQLVTSSGGAVPVEEMARTIGWTRQHFARRFTDEFGLSSKLAARLARFNRPSGAFRPGAPHASAYAVLRVDRAGRRGLRLLRPGAHDARLRHVRRVSPGATARRGGSSILPRRHRRGGASSAA